MHYIIHQRGKDPLYKVWHTMRDNMILFVHCGEGSIVLQDKIYSMCPGALCFIASGRQHYTMPSSPENYDRSKIFAENALLSRVLRAVPEKSDFYRLFTENSVVYAPLPQKECERVEEILGETESGSEELFVISYLRLMSLLKQYASETTATREDDISTVLDYINRSYSQPLTLDDVCARVHICKHHLCRKFKSAIGVTVMEYVNETRLAAARDMLVDGELPIGEIAWRCGFSSSSVFCQAFKEANGITASRYRLEYKQRK